MTEPCSAPSFTGRCRDRLSTAAFALFCASVLDGCVLGSKLGLLLFRAFGALAVGTAVVAAALAIAVFASRGRLWGAALASVPTAGVAAAVGSSCTQAFTSARSLTGTYVESFDVLLWIAWPTAITVLLAAVSVVALALFRHRGAPWPLPVSVAGALSAVGAAGYYVFLVVSLTTTTLGR
ncbi:MAG: hypothetical protein JNL79_36425 [Myxococcales bacterium]|nr:hypothetical protein [Myxococcales bacterium]